MCALSVREAGYGSRYNRVQTVICRWAVVPTHWTCQAVSKALLQLLLLVLLVLLLPSLFMLLRQA